MEFMLTLKNDKIKSKKHFTTIATILFGVFWRKIIRICSYFMLLCGYMSTPITSFTTFKITFLTRKFLGAFWRKYIRHSSYKILR